MSDSPRQLYELRLAPLQFLSPGAATTSKTSTPTPTTHRPPQGTR